MDNITINLCEVEEDSSSCINNIDNQSYNLLQNQINLLSGFLYTGYFYASQPLINLNLINPTINGGSISIESIDGDASDLVNYNSLNLNSSGGFSSLANNGMFPQSISIGISPFTYISTQPNNTEIYINGGLINSIQKNNYTIFSSISGSPMYLTINLQSGESIIITYNIAPSINFSPF